MTEADSCETKRPVFGSDELEGLVEAAVVDGSKSASLPGGDYFLRRPLQLSERHRGLRIASAPGERAVLYGGQPLVGWRERGAGVWSAPAPELPGGIRTLLVNGRLASRARLPETGYFLHDTPFDSLWRSTHEGGWERQPTEDELLTLKFRDGDLGDWLEVRDAEITVFHMWDESLVGVESIDRQHQTIRFSNAPGYPPGAFADEYNMPRRYVVWNIAEGLTAPGQWRHDRVAGEIVYRPRDGEDLAEATAIVPLMENVIVIESFGHDSSQKWVVADIELRDLTIAVTNAPLMTGAFGAKRFDGAVSIRGADDCRLVGVEVFGVGAHAVKASGDRLRVEGCRLHHTGASGLRHLGGESVITRNHIHHVGMAFPSAIALYVGATDPNDTEEWRDAEVTRGVTIAQNTLHDTPYTAIAVGGPEHTIEGNLIYRAMQDLYDGAGIYITFCEGVTLRGNFVRDIKESAGAGTSAYYLDEMSKGCTVEGNLSIDVARPMHNHISRDNAIRNNVFVTPGAGRLTIERSSDYAFERNVVCSPEGFELYDCRACARITGNVFAVEPSKLITHELDHYDIVATKPVPLGDRNSTDDSGIEISRTGVVTIKPGSPADTFGIRPIDVSRAGADDGISPPG